MIAKMKKNTIVWIVFVAIIVVVIVVAAVIAMNGKGQNGSSANEATNEELRQQSQSQTFEDGTVNIDLPEGGNFTVEDDELEAVEN